MVNHSFEFFKAGLGKIEKIHSKDQYGLFFFFFIFNFSFCILSVS